MDEYKIRWFDTSGALKYESVDFVDLVYRRQVNHPGLAQVTYSGDHGLAGAIVDKWTMEIWRRNRDMEIDWYRDFDGIYRAGRRLGRSPGRFYASCPGQLHRLGWRHILWTAGQDLRSEFTADKAETIMKTLVSYNAGSNATTGNGRLRAGVMSEIAVQTDGANGNTINHYCAWEELLKSLQRLASIAGGDFDLVKTSTTAWEFRWYTGQLGTDRTATITFAEGLGNMDAAEYIADHREERTVALAAGAGEGADRETRVKTGADYGAGNDIETYVDARHIEVGDSAGLDDAAAGRLAELGAITSFSFDVLQTPACYYGKHYFLGDKVTAINPFTGASSTLKVDAVGLTTRPHAVRVYLT